jgi:hypothetical protein
MGSTSKTTFSQLLCHSALSSHLGDSPEARISLLSERFPTSGNDNHETLLMNLLVTVMPFNLLPLYYCNLFPGLWKFFQILDQFLYLFIGQHIIFKFSG